MPEALERAIARFRRSPENGSAPKRSSVAAFRAPVELRLSNLERDVGDLKGRINGLIFVVLGAGHRASSPEVVRLMTTANCPSPIADSQSPIAHGFKPKPAAWPKLRPYQVHAERAIIASALHGRGLTITVAMARQAGKNEISAQAEAFLLGKFMRRAVDGIKCAPTFEPQGRISLTRLWTRMVQAGMARDGSREGGQAVRFTEARMLFLSAAPSANVVGHTAGILLEVDEAQDVDREKFDREFRPMAAPAGATTVYYGTPWDDSTLLQQALQTNLELERRDGIRRHFAADWTAMAESNPAYARYVEGERARLGEDHPLFRTQYALKTVSGRGRLFSGSQLAQTQGTHGRQHAPRPGELYIAGLDLAGQEWADAEGYADETRLRGVSTRGRDATVLTIARAVIPASDAIIAEPRLEIVEHIAFSGTPHDALFARLADVLGEVWRVRRLAVDTTGLGETLGRLLIRRLGERVVRPVRFTAESKSKLGYGLLAAVNGGRLKVYAADGSLEYTQFQREIEAACVHFRPNQQMNFFVQPADGHDDYLMSAVLAVDAANDIETRPRIARGHMAE